MLKAPTEFIIIFIFISVLLILALGVFVTMIIFRYQQRQNSYFIDIESLKTSYQNSLLQSQLEIQEQTFQNISREIHDNIGQKLTLAKLQLNTLTYNTKNETASRVNDSISMIGEAITDLSDISKSMNSEILLNNGLIKAMEFETAQLLKSGRYKIHFSVTGEAVFLDANTELVLFRIAQEALANIIKHADASEIKIRLHYDNVLVTMAIHDNGKGFRTEGNYFGSGLSNMKKRADTIKANLLISSTPNECTKIQIEIPLYEKSNPL